MMLGSRRPHTAAERPPMVPACLVWARPTSPAPLLAQTTLPGRHLRALKTVNLAFDLG